MTGTATLTEFLLARIAEDEAAASDVLWARTRPRSANGSPHWRVSVTGLCVMDGLSPAVARGAGPAMAHIARFDPARVLAECEAKRRIVEIYTENDEGAEPEPNYGEAAYQAMLALALPYADHPDFREEWRA